MPNGSHRTNLAAALCAVAFTTLAYPAAAERHEMEQSRQGATGKQPMPQGGMTDPAARNFGGMRPGMMGGGMGPGMMGPGMMGGGMGMGHGMMGGGMMGGGMGMGHGMMGGGMGMIGMLDLSDDQIDRLTKLQQETSKRQRELMRKMWEEQDKMQDLFMAEKRDPEAIGKAYGRVSDLQRQALEARLQAHQKMEDVLTKDQKQQLRQMQRRSMIMGY